MQYANSFKIYLAMLLKIGTKYTYINEKINCEIKNLHYFKLFIKTS